MRRITILDHRPNTALLVIDVQHSVMAAAHQREVVHVNTGTLIDRARHANVPVVWIRHSDGELMHGTGGRNALLR